MQYYALVGYALNGHRAFAMREKARIFITNRFQYTIFHIINEFLSTKNIYATSSTNIDNG